jgi:hypothetical protein
LVAKMAEIRGIVGRGARPWYERDKDCIMLTTIAAEVIGIRVITHDRIA